MPMASHQQNQLAARCIAELADSARFSDNRLAVACSDVTPAVAAAALERLAVQMEVGCSYIAAEVRSVD